MKPLAAAILVVVCALVAFLWCGVLGYHFALVKIHYTASLGNSQTLFTGAEIQCRILEKGQQPTKEFP